VYAADLWIFRPYLPHGPIQGHELLPVLAEPGPRGGIELLPCRERDDVPVLAVVQPPEQHHGQPVEVVEDALPVVPPREDRRPAAPRPPAAWPWLVGILVLLLACVGGALLMLYWPAGADRVVLSNLQTSRALVGQATYHLDYRFAATPGPSARYFLVADSSGLKTEVELRPEPAQGTATINVFRPLAMPGRVSFHVEEENPGQGRRRVSNTLE
jgi:hypothetical protein